MIIKKLLLLVLAVAVSACGVSGISLNSMYLKQNYLQIAQYQDQFQALDDYAVLKVCQSLIKLQQFGEFQRCYQELELRSSRQQGALKGIQGDAFTPALTRAIFAAMQAELALELGDYKQAVLHGEKALQLLEAEPYALTTIVDVAGTSYEVIKVLMAAYPALDDKTNTLAMITRAKALAEYKYYGDSGFRLIKDFKILPLLTQGYYALADYQQALKHSSLAIDELSNIGFFEKAFYSSMTAVSSATTGERTAEGNSQSFADTLFAHSLQPKAIKARSELELGKYAEAKASFDEILATKLISGITSLYYPVLHDRGRVAEALGDNKAAIDFYRQAIEVIETSRASLTKDNHKVSYVGNKQAVYQSLVKVLFKQGEVAAAFEVAESAKARALLDLLAGKQGLTAEAAPRSAEAVSLAQEYKRLQADVDNKGALAKSQSRALDRGLLLAARKKLTSAAPQYASLISVNPTQSSDVQLLLEEGELLLEYYGDSNELFIFAVSKHAISASYVDAKQLSELVAKFRASVQQVNNDDYKLVGKKLYQHLLKPVEELVAEAAAVAIVPHGVLHYLPFDALYTDNQFFIDAKPMRILPSASVLKFLSNKTHLQDSLLVLGNPDLGDSRYDLAGAEQEAIAIASNKNHANILLRKKATETAVKAHGQQYKYIHLASHGLFDERAPLNSRLLLAKDAANDGSLTVSEIYNLKLDADLVTLSACETALGKVASGDDVLGFSRGFLYAGASSIVSSLWKVDDEATSFLMQRFYKNLASLDKRTALTQAQLALKQHYPHPYYWAAFQLTGGL
ncbi:CHAT domain-containing protein [Dasania sp. GY-MA-18]|uniref:CHAT domain-containing protein n=1 Tax=Dasania phycosphaerae TaxID=2950436 RepID=A0A9J6RJW6_9GAMM|nr:MULTISPECIES: CHAT domain-containing protein [Dasania]MCR8922343.1 CHAT domain-containing protein [Dasania sp. GY-MA-18]MCZ0864771.1 CHAT domain-containing protein [Dasania phycosphaerae]MCZ0868499.1 CHAT domain-containing protein [Dasania phycosphaerae]